MVAVELLLLLLQVVVTIRFVLHRSKDQPQASFATAPRAIQRRILTLNIFVMIFLLTESPARIEADFLL